MNVELTEQEWAVLLNAAALAPYGQIAPVIGEVMQQLQPKKEQGNGSMAVDSEALHQRDAVR